MYQTIYFIFILGMNIKSIQYVINLQKTRLTNLFLHKKLDTLPHFGGFLNIESSTLLC